MAHRLIKIIPIAPRLPAARAMRAAIADSAMGGT